MLIRNSDAACQIRDPAAIAARVTPMISGQGVRLGSSTILGLRSGAGSTDQPAYLAASSSEMSSFE